MTYSIEYSEAEILEEYGALINSFPYTYFRINDYYPYEIEFREKGIVLFIIKKSIRKPIFIGKLEIGYEVFNERMRSFIHTFKVDGKEYRFTHSKMFIKHFQNRIIRRGYLARDISIRSIIVFLFNNCKKLPIDKGYVLLGWNWQEFNINPYCPDCGEEKDILTKENIGNYKKYCYCRRCDRYFLMEDGKPKIYRPKVNMSFRIVPNFNYLDFIKTSKGVDYIREKDLRLVRSWIYNNSGISTLPCKCGEEMDYCDFGVDQYECYKCGKITKIIREKE